MKPFDLEKAIAGEPVVTRSGEAVTQLRKFDGVDGSLALVGVLNRNICIWENTGRADFVGKSDSPGDLFMADKPKKTKRVVCMIRKSVAGGITGDAHQITFAHPIEAEPDYLRQMSPDKWQRFEFDLEVG